MAVSWALLGALCGLPAALVTLQSPPHGLALAFGALPAAAIGVRRTRRSRHLILVVGLAIGAGIVADDARRANGRCRAELRRRRRGRPRAGQADGTGCRVRLAALPVLAGSEGPGSSRAARASRDDRVRRARLGLAGATCAGLGYLLDLDHKGWATAACLLVMRPSAEMTRLRGAGRALSVTAGALAAALLALGDVPSAVIAAAVLAALTGLAATRPSRWYVTGGFTTFIVILLLVYGSPNQAEGRFLERVGETLLGVGVALFFGVALPARGRPVQDLPGHTPTRSSP